MHSLHVCFVRENPVKFQLTFDTFLSETNLWLLDVNSLWSQLGSLDVTAHWNQMPLCLHISTVISKFRKIFIVPAQWNYSGSLDGDSQCPKIHLAPSFSLSLPLQCYDCYASASTHLDVTRRRRTMTFLLSGIGLRNVLDGTGRWRLV